MTGARCGSMTPSPLRWRLLSWTTPPQADPQFERCRPLEVQLHPLFAPWDGAVEANLGNRRWRIVFGDHWIDGHGVHAGDNHRVANWVEAECQCPFDLVVIPNVDVLVKNIGDLRDRHL